MSASGDENRWIQVVLSILPLSTKFLTGILQDSKSQTSFCQLYLLASRQKNSSYLFQFLVALTSILHKRFTPKQMQYFVYRFGKLCYIRLHSHYLWGWGHRIKGSPRPKELLWQDWDSSLMRYLYFLCSRAKSKGNRACKIVLPTTSWTLLISPMK